MKLNRILSVLCVGTLVFSLTACGENKAFLKHFDSKTQSAAYNDEIIAANEKYTLCFESQKQSVYLKDNSTGTIYNTVADDFSTPKYDEWGDKVARHPQTDSLINVEYMAGDNGNIENSISFTAANQDGRVVCKKIKNGIKLSYYFHEIKIMVPLSITLNQKGISLQILPTEIEEGENKIVSVSVAPFMCSVENDKSDAYLFYPSGSGTLIYPKSSSSQGTIYSSEVYGTDPSIEIWDKPFEEMSIRLPVYGYKTFDKGGVTIIEKGAENAILNAFCGSISTGFSSVYTKFQLRGYTNNISDVVGGNRVKNPVYSDRVVSHPLKISFYPLERENNNYVGMAEIYREYLKSQYEIKESSNDKIINFNALGGILISKSFLGIPYTTLYKATTFEELEEILSDYETKNPNVKLYGFGKNGLSTESYAGDFSVDSKLGGKSGIKDFETYCKNKNIDSYFDVDFIYYKSGSGGFNRFFDRAEAASHKIAYSYKFDKSILGRIDDTRMILMGRANIVSAVDKFLRKTNSWNLCGISLSTLSNTAYSDYSNKDASSHYAKSNMQIDVGRAYKNIKAHSKKIMSTDANDYAAVYSDIITSTPNRSSNADIFDRDIPFYQIVFKGLKSISSSPVNLSGNRRETFLKAVECGVGLEYTISANYDNVLLDSDTSVFYNSLYSDVKSNIKADINEYSALFDAVKNVCIVNHSIMNNGLHFTEFENGVKVFVNYSDKPIESEFGIINPYNFVYGGDI